MLSFLVGEILAVSKEDLAVIWCGALSVLALAAAAVSRAEPGYGARQQGRPKAHKLVLAITVAVAIKVVGALLIIPAI